MMIHSFDRWILHQDLLGITRAGFEFRGKAAHASADPWEGVNALDAVIQTFNSVSMTEHYAKASMTPSSLDRSFFQETCLLRSG